MKAPAKLPLRVLQVSINSCTIVTGFCTFLPLGYVWNYFLSQCVLYGNVAVTVKNRTVTLDSGQSLWGNASTCNYTTYTAVVAVIHAFIWCWFFVLMRSTLKEQNQEFNILLPSFLLHTVIFVATFVGSSMVSAGSNHFCRHLKQGQLDQRYTCDDLQTMQWDIFTSMDKKQNFATYLLTAKICSWLMSLSVLAQCVLTGHRLYKRFLKPPATVTADKTKSQHSTFENQISWDQDEDFTNESSPAHV